MIFDWRSQLFHLFEYFKVNIYSMVQMKLLDYCIKKKLEKGCDKNNSFNFLRNDLHWKILFEKIMIPKYNCVQR